jgi:hypothetical protein
MALLTALARHTIGDRMAARQKLDRRRNADFETKMTPVILLSFHGTVGTLSANLAITITK